MAPIICIYRNRSNSPQ